MLDLNPDKLETDSWAQMDLLLYTFRENLMIWQFLLNKLPKKQAISWIAHNSINGVIENWHMMFLHHNGGTKTTPLIETKDFLYLGILKNDYVLYQRKITQTFWYSWSWQCL